ncbi:MAG: hypothetical protein K1X75_03025 [Leptospirales bacterium]|nr:hypothetical protein [Leptospirales bacterium]
MLRYSIAFDLRRRLPLCSLLFLSSILPGCGPLSDIPPPTLFDFLAGGAGGNRIGVVSSDLGAAGRFSTMTLEGAPLPGFTSIHSDAVARSFDGRVYIVNRLNRDNIQVLNPALFYQTEAEFSVGAGANPHDIAVVSPSLAFVSLYRSSEVLAVHPSAGLILSRISLAAFADPFDGIPELDSLYYEAGRLFVSVQRLNQNDPVFVRPPTDYSSLVEIDAASLMPVAEYRMPALNPFSKLRRAQLQGRPVLYVAAPGYFGFNFRLDGGVVAFDLSTRSFFPQLLYSESAAGGDIVDVAISNDQQGYALVSYADFSHSIQRFNPSNGQFVSQLAYFPSTGGYVAGLLLTDSGVLAAAIASFASPGVVLFDTNSGDRPITPAPINVGLRPLDLVYVP